MKMMMLTGAVLGFGVGVTFSLLRESSWPTVVWHACVAAYVAGIMFRWWGRHWMKNLRLALVEKQEAALREAALPATPASAVAGASASPRIAASVSAGGANGTNSTGTNKR